jgi:hypothetical protein
MVWDKKTDAPCEFAGRALVGLSEKEANSAVEVMMQVLDDREAEEKKAPGRRGSAA